MLFQFAFQSARARRREFAVLRTPGLRRRQLRAVTVWQLSTLAGLAAVLGVPAGAAAGHWAWTVFASALGVAPGTSIPAGAAPRARPAELLRAE